MTTLEQLRRAKDASAAIAVAREADKNRALAEMAASLELHTAEILARNQEDVAQAQGHISPVMLDRLRLTEQRIQDMAQGVRALIDLPDPVGRALEERTLENSLLLRRISVPLGVVAIVYESRPNVTSDAAALALKSGNACVLRGGREAFRTANAITNALRQGLRRAGLPEDCVCMIQDKSHDSVQTIMQAVGLVDLLIPRGGAGLIRACVEGARVPCIQTGTGICHIYVERSARQDMALSIIENAKASRPSVCNAEEVLLVHSAIADTFLPRLYDRLAVQRPREGLPPVQLRCDSRAAAILGLPQAEEQDFDTEFLDYILAVAVVDSTEEAIRHIARHSTGHSESIITETEADADLFCARVDSAAVYVNASTRFTDGGQFGLGCEMGISTQKLHARGPMGLRELTSYKYVVRGNGQIR